MKVELQNSKVREMKKRLRCGEFKVSRGRRKLVKDLMSKRWFSQDYFNEAYGKHCANEWKDSLNTERSRFYGSLVHFEVLLKVRESDLIMDKYKEGYYYINQVNGKKLLEYASFDYVKWLIIGNSIFLAFALFLGLDTIIEPENKFGMLFAVVEIYIFMYLIAKLVEFRNAFN